MKESIEKVKETTESLAAKEEKLDDEINDTCDQLVIEDHIDRDDCDENLDDEINGTTRLKSIIPPPRRPLCSTGSKMMRARGTRS